MDDRRNGITPQLAMRVAFLGGGALLLFAIIFFRLWFLQVLSGDQYVTHARENRVRKVRIEAPRGDIVDRNGTVLVDTRVAPVVKLLPNHLPKAELKLAEEYRKALSRSEQQRLNAKEDLHDFEQELRRKKTRITKKEKSDRAKLTRASQRAPFVPTPALPREEVEMVAMFKRLGSILGMSTREIHARVLEGIADQPYANVTIKTDVPRSAYNYIREREEKFPGVVAEKLYLREYPHKELGAQLFGTLREVSPKELKSKRYRGVVAGTRIGKTGIEETYDYWLRGRDGYSQVVVNALGERDERRKSNRHEPKQGQQLKLTLDLGVQRAAHRALKRALGVSGGGSARAGAFVAMDPSSGEVIALGSYPSFDANVFAKPLSKKKFDQLNSEENGAPLFNRAIAAAYPTGSIFKPITAFAALDSGIIAPGTVIFDDGLFKLGNIKFQNAKGLSYGSLTLSRALTVSSDVFFYNLGAKANARGPIIQKWARRLSLGKPTGIDLPGEFDGLVPDRYWRDTGYKKYTQCVQRNHLQPQTFKALTTCGGIDRPWTAGDNVNLSVGQGDLQATPLQMAVAYSAIANGGKIVKPHLGKTIEDGMGRSVEEMKVPPRRNIEMNKGAQETILQGLRGAAMEAGGTSADVFKGFGNGAYTVYGKTGTAERAGQADQAWYAVYVPHPTKPIVVIVTVEKGGFGAATAAPAARLILAEWFKLGEKKFQRGSSKTR